MIRSMRRESPGKGIGMAGNFFERELGKLPDRFYGQPGVHPVIPADEAEFFRCPDLPDS